MADHDGIGVDAGLDVFGEFECFVEFFGGLSLLLSLLRDLGEVHGSEAVFVAMDVVLQCGDELCNDCGGHDNAGCDLLGLLHSEEEVDDEFVLTLKDDGTSGEDAAGDVLGHERTDV